MTNKTASRLAVLFLTVVGICLFLFIVFIVCVVLACGQYRPPVQEPEEMIVEPDSCVVYECEEDSSESVIF